MHLSQASVATEHASSYLTKLCKHWSHRFQVEYTEQAGTIHLPRTLCTLVATPQALHVHLELGEGEDQARIEEVVEEHLQRFGFREELTFVWQRTVGTPAVH